jgi:uncharacterized protein
MRFRHQLHIGLDDLDAVIYGTAILASGGGGDPYLGRLILLQALQKYGTTTLLDPAKVKNHSLVIALGAVGAPTVALEKFPNLHALAGAVAKLEQHLQRKVDALVAAEAGGLNAILPIALGLKLGLPVIDADGMGRAFPKGNMMTYGIYGGHAAPLSIVDDHMNAVIIEADDNRKAEELSRRVVDGMGGIAMGAIYPMSGTFFKTAAVPGTITLSRDLGRAALTASREKRDPIDAMIGYFKHGRKDARYAARLFTGKITGGLPQTKGGFVQGTVELEDAKSSENCTISFQNENLIVHIGDRVIALVPDIITILDQDTGDAITTENLRYGQRVAVFGLAAPDILRTPEALEHVGPRAFGIDLDYRPIESLTGE